MRVSKYFFKDATLHTPIEYQQMLIIMYNDLLTDLNTLGLYVLMNGKSELHYEYVFKSVINLLTNFRKKELSIEAIVTDTETALINTIKNYFPKTRSIACYFHYCQDIIRNIPSYGLYKN